MRIHAARLHRGSERYLKSIPITNIPYIGGIVGLVDPLLIFGQERRCLHDLIASTQVIVGDPEDEPKAYGY